MSELVKLNFDHKHIAILTLNRPEAFNALNKQLQKEILAAINKINDDKTIFCTIITGAGEKAFCAGADLKERRGLSNDEVVKSSASIGELVLAVEKMPMPVIAALNGVAFGGGLELALGCDLRIAAEHAKMGLTETSLAIIPGAGGTQRLSRLIGIGKAKKLIFTSRRISAQEASDLGIIEEIASSDKLLEEAIKLAEEIVVNGPIALQQAKIAINQGMQTDLMTGLEIERLSYRGLIDTEDRIEGLQAFAEKRTPIYKGK